VKDRALFGPAGNSEAFYADGFKNTIDAMPWVAEMGLDLYEYQCGQGVRGSAEAFTAIGNKAKECGIGLSLHAPYFISLSGIDTEKRLKSIDYIEQSVGAAKLLQADTVVIHTGSASKISRQEAVELAKDTMYKMLEKLGDCGVNYGLETMGKQNQLGTLDEVIEICSIDSLLHPVVDFGHLNARDCGNVFPTSDDYKRIFDLISERLGAEYAENLHCHFSKIEFTDKGEKKHLTFDDTEYGPDFEPLCEVIAKENLSPHIICESAGTQARDALMMKNEYNKYLI